MILTGHEILRQIEQGRIAITPFEPKRVNPASVDLTLGSEVGVYQEYALCDAADHKPKVSRGSVPPNRPYDGADILPFNMAKVYDTKEPAPIRKFQIDPEVGWVLKPGVGYLMHTAERVCTDFYVPVLDGKSSIGRLFVKVHETAGFGDPGFDGQYTLEVTTSMFAVRVYPGMRFCQIRFHKVDGELKSYKETGHYRGDAAVGPIGSRINETGFG